MALADFERLLKNAMGLDSASIGASAIDRAVQERQRVCELADLDVYWHHANASATELQALIEAVVVPETWFFRDRDAFAWLARTAGEEWEHAGGLRSLLSLPASTGEEPYSMAMALLDADVPPDCFHVDAVDISGHAVETARRAVYRNNSFRGGDLTFRSRHFDETPSGYRLRDHVRRQVNFFQRNLFAPDFLQTARSYDVIFCRNLLIYFDRATQDRAITVLDRLLSPKGILFVAPSETGLLLNHGFASVKVAMTFAFRRAEAVAPSKRLRRSAVKPRFDPTRARPQPGTATAGPAPKAPAARLSLEPSPKRPSEPQIGLDEPTRLANDGRFVEAALACEEHLRRCGPSAEAFHLLGVVRDAIGNAADAADCYRKALYLDPNRHEVLIHLALLMERLDRRSEAHVLRARARRIAQNGQPS